MITDFKNWRNYLMVENDDLNFCNYSGLPSPMAYMQTEEESIDLRQAPNLDRIIEMAWEDRTTFEAIKKQFGLNESDVRRLMKQHLKFSSYKLWRTRVEKSKTKHQAKRVNGINRFKSNLQRVITHNKLSKRRT